MAEGILSVALENLCSISTEPERRGLGRAVKDIEKITASFLSIRAMVSDAESRAHQVEFVRDWLSKVKDVAYEVDDALGEWRTELLRSQIYEIHGGVRICNRKVHTHYLSPSFLFSQVVMPLKIRHGMKKLRKKSDALIQEIYKYGLRVDDRIRFDTDEISSYGYGGEIFGREGDRQTIVSFLLSESSQETTSLPVVSILGMAGMGKTALAQLVFNDEEVRKHFHTRIWVCVSMDFDVRKVMQAIIESVTLEKSRGPNSLDHLKKTLCDLLSGKRFLLVLDDVWAENPEPFDTLKLALNHGAPRSGLVFTTRNEKVAKAMGTTYLHTLPALSEEDCWSIFKQRAFGVGREIGNREECEKFEEIGKSIAKKSQGVPLLVKALVRNLRFKTNTSEWLSVLHSQTRGLKLADFLSELLLSYENLPSNLKQPFAFCSVFPKDYEIECDTLIKLWTAQGFISSNRESDMEEQGVAYLNDLCNHSLYQDVVKDNKGNVVKCKMHGFVHDIAHFVALDDCHSMEMEERGEGQIMAHHLSCYDLEPILTSLYSSNSLRTLILLNKGGVGTVPIPRDLFSQLRSLRVLDLSCSNIEELPSSIDKLKQIRFIDLSNTKVSKLPQSLTSLLNLQTLRLNGCVNLEKLPKGMAWLTSLRHLEFEDCYSLCYLPKDIERLTSLRTLSRFMIGDRDNESWRKLGALKDLNLLQGRLVISHLDRMASKEEAEEANLKAKVNLKSLVLDCKNSFIFDSADFKIHYQTLENLYEDAVKTSTESVKERLEEVFEGIHPHENLDRLEIWNYISHKFPSWFEEPLLTNIIDLKLVNCDNVVDLPPLGGLKSLKSLHICRMDMVEKIGHGFYGNGDPRGFPVLDCLIIEKMSNLKEWAEQTDMPCLTQLILRNCPMLMTLPHLPEKLRKLEISNCTSLPKIPGRLPQLEDLVLKGKDGVFRSSLPDLPNLLSLKVMLSPELTSLRQVLGELNKLETLVIHFCPKLESSELGLEWLPALKELIIAGCSLLNKGTLMGAAKRRLDVKVDNKRIQW